LEGTTVTIAIAPSLAKEAEISAGTNRA